MNHTERMALIMKPFPRVIVRSQSAMTWSGTLIGDRMGSGEGGNRKRNTKLETDDGSNYAMRREDAA